MMKMRECLVRLFSRFRPSAKFCSFFSKFTSTEHANVRGIPPVQDHPPRAPSATCAAYSMPELIEQKYFKQTRPKLVSASGQRTQGVQGQARHWHVKGIKLKKLADSLEMAPLSPTGKVSKHTKETQSLTCCLPATLFSSALSGGRSPRHYAPTLVRAGGLPARARRRVLYHISRINIPRINILRTIFFEIYYRSPY